MDFLEIDTEENELVPSVNRTIETVNQPTSEMHETPTLVVDVP